MTLKELIQDECFSKLLDENNSKELTLYLSNLRSQSEIDSTTYRDLTNMFKELDIFQDVYMYHRMPLDTKIKYLTTGSILYPSRKVLDLRNKVLANQAINGPEACKLIIDSTTERLDEQSNKWDALININLQDHNFIQVDSLPDNLIFIFNANRDDLMVNTKFKINKNIDFTEFLEKQTYSSLHPKRAIINMILENTERF